MIWTSSVIISNIIVAVLSYDGFVRHFTRLVALLYLIVRKGKLNQLLESRRELKEKVGFIFNSLALLKLFML